MRQTFEFIVSIVMLLIPTKLLVVDSTPLEDYRDKDAKTGFTSRGPFKGFKTHLATNQFGLPLKTIVTTGNKHDSPFFSELIDLNVKDILVLADAGYDSNLNRKVAKKKEMKPVIAKNPRRTKKKFKLSKVLKKKRYIIEQTNSILKEMLQKS